MFITAIEEVQQYTRPIHSITRFFDSKEVHPGAATLVMVNKDGWALTCKHVIDHLIAGDQICSKFNQYKSELSALRSGKNLNQRIKQLKKKYGYTSNSISEVRNCFMDCVEGNLAYRWCKHPKYDIGLIHFTGYKKLLVQAFPKFPKDTSNLKQGKFLCRLGYPFPEFNNYKYDSNSDSIMWTQVGQIGSPRFPIEGMLTRHLRGDGEVAGFELSTPGLRGQSGGPVFDKDGVVWGIQAATNHLDLDFDVNQEVKRAGKRVRVKDSAFMHVGHCIHIDVMKKFMTDNKVTFSEV